MSWLKILGVPQVLLEASLCCRGWLQLRLFELLAAQRLVENVSCAWVANHGVTQFLDCCQEIIIGLVARVRIFLVDYLLELVKGSVHQNLFKLLEAFWSVDILLLAVDEEFGANELTEDLNVVP